MKKLFLTLIALAATMSIDAQMVEIYHGDQLVTKYRTVKGDKVVFKEPTPTTGKATRTDNIEVNWVQLWEDGPKFAECNVGATSATEYGNYFTWAEDKDIATTKWGSNWRLPTKDEFDALLTNCTCKWTTQSSVYGLLCKGKEGTAFEPNSLFLPAAGNRHDGSVSGLTLGGDYWSSTPVVGSDNQKVYCLLFSSGTKFVGSNSCDYGFSVRAVLVE